MGGFQHLQQIYRPITILLDARSYIWRNGHMKTKFNTELSQFECDCSRCYGEKKLFNVYTFWDEFYGTFLLCQNGIKSARMDDLFPRSAKNVEK